MYKVIKPRGGGKTMEILHLAEEKGATVVCANPQLMREKIKTEGFNEDIRCISYRDLLSTLGSRDQYLIDEIDGLIRYLNTGILGYSLSPED